MFFVVFDVNERTSSDYQYKSEKAVVTNHRRRTIEMEFVPNVNAYMICRVFNLTFSEISFTFYQKKGLMTGTTTPRTIPAMTDFWVKGTGTHRLSG